MREEEREREGMRTAFTPLVSQIWQQFVKNISKTDIKKEIAFIIKLKVNGRKG